MKLPKIRSALMAFASMSLASCGAAQGADGVNQPETETADNGMPDRRMSAGDMAAGMSSDMHSGASGDGTRRINNAPNT